MPFSSDEQRRAAFAHMSGHGTYLRHPKGGKAGQAQALTHPRAPKQKKPKKTPKTSSNPAFGVGTAGYAGNYSSQPNFSNWWTSFPNTTAAPEPLVQAGSWMSQGYGAINTQQATWDDTAHGNRALTTTEKMFGLGIAGVLAMQAGGIFALAETGSVAVDYFGNAIVTDVVGAGTQLGVAGAQGGALGYAGVSLSGIEMTINDSPHYTYNPNTNNYDASYPDLVGTIASKFRKKKK